MTHPFNICCNPIETDLDKPNRLLSSSYFTLPISLFTLPPAVLGSAFGIFPARRLAVMNLALN